MLFGMRGISEMLATAMPTYAWEIHILVSGCENPGNVLWLGLSEQLLWSAERHFRHQSRRNEMALF
jgi:hypothetical protein